MAWRNSFVFADTPADYKNFQDMTAVPTHRPIDKRVPRESTPSNPFMNTIPGSDRSVPPGVCRDECRANFKELYPTETDLLWGTSNRAFFTMPDATPDTRTEFAHALYGSGPNVKHGSIFSRHGFPSASVKSTGHDVATSIGSEFVDGRVEGTQGSEPYADHNYNLPGSGDVSAWVNNSLYNYGFGGLNGGIPFDSSTPGQASPMVLLPSENGPVPFM